MISDSIPWRDELLKIAKRLERLSKKRNWSEKASFVVERDIMLGAYAVRRLLESEKVSRSTSSIPIPAQSFSRSGAIPDSWNRHEIDALYCLDSPREVTLSLRSFCNQMIHSFVWMIGVDDESERFTGIYAASEHECRSRLYFFSIETFLEAYRRIGNEDIVGGNLRRDQEGIAHWISLTQEEVNREGRSRLS